MAKKTKFQVDVSNTRRMLRKRMELLAKSHRGCKSARGCGCYIDKALVVLEKTEQDLFSLELASLSEPDSKPDFVQTADGRFIEESVTA